MNPTEPTPPVDAGTRSEPGTGTLSRIFCVLGGLIAIFGGIGLATLKARGDNSMIEAIANGMGYYFIGKGVFMIAITLNLKAAVSALRPR